MGGVEEMPQASPWGCPKSGGGGGDKAEGVRGGQLCAGLSLGFAFAGNIFA